VFTTERSQEVSEWP